MGSGKCRVADPEIPASNYRAHEADEEGSVGQT